MKVLVTGGAGFLGSHLIPSLLKRGDQVIVQDVVAPDLASRIKEHLNKVQYRWQSVADTSPAQLEGVNAVIHLASQGDVPLADTSPIYTYILNTESMIHLLLALRQRKTPIIAMSTENVYGAVAPERLPAREEERTMPRNPYAASKVAMEALCHSYSSQYGIPTRIIRSSTLFGERSRPRQVLSIFIKQALANQPLTIEGDGSQTRDFNYASNMVDAIEKVLDTLAGTADRTFDMWNIGSGREVSIKEIVDLILRMTGSGSKVSERPRRLGEEGRISMSIEKAERELGYRPIYSIEDGLERTIDWMRKHEL